MMKYWEYILIAVVFLYAGWLSFRRLQQIRLDFFHKTALQNLLKKNQADRGRLYFNSEVLYQVIAYLHRQRNKTARRALLNLICGKATPAISFLHKSRQTLQAVILEALSTTNFDLKKLEKIKTPQAEIELAGLLFSRGNLPKTKQLVERNPDGLLSSYAKGRKRFYQSYQFLADGDLLSASQCAAESGKLFNQNKAYFEEAQSYLLLGTIYRLSCIEDVAKFMFDAAGKLFSQYHDEAGMADVFGNRGMLWVLQEKFVEAEDEFKQALSLNQRLNRQAGEADILNQMALLNLLQNNHPEALKQIKQSEKINKALQNRRGLAFSAELLAHLYYEDKQYKKAVSHAQKAVELYKNSPNAAAYFESIYLQALAEFEGGNLEQAEALLRDLITFSKKKPTSFHIAGAYTLMGLIQLKYAKFKEAKVWFQEAAALEQKNDRYSGAATDYANISLIELKTGNKEQGQKALEAAIDFAKIYGETELSEMLCDRLKNLKV